MSKPYKNTCRKWLNQIPGTFNRKAIQAEGIKFYTTFSHRFPACSKEEVKHLLRRFKHNSRSTIMYEHTRRSKGK